MWPVAPMTTTRLIGGPLSTRAVGMAIFPCGLGTAAGARHGPGPVHGCAGQVDARSPAALAWARYPTSPGFAPRRWTPAQPGARRPAGRARHHEMGRDNVSVIEVAAPAGPAA